MHFILIIILSTLINGINVTPTKSIKGEFSTQLIKVCTSCAQVGHANESSQKCPNNPRRCQYCGILGHLTRRSQFCLANQNNINFEGHVNETNLQNEYHRKCMSCDGDDHVSITSNLCKLNISTGVTYTTSTAYNINDQPVLRPLKKIKCSSCHEFGHTKRSLDCKNNKNKGVDTSEIIVNNNQASNYSTIQISTDSMISNIPVDRIYLRNSNIVQDLRVHSPNQLVNKKTLDRNNYKTKKQTNLNKLFEKQVG